MFVNHQPKISAFARENPENMAKVLKFVILTIRVRLFNIPADMEILENAKNPADLNGILYGFKVDSIQQIDAEKDSFFAQAESIYFHAENERVAAENLLSLFAQIKGLGLAKAGFACQLIYGLSGCLDSHNLERFGINPNAFRSNKYKYAKTLKTKRRYISDYCDTVEKFGGTASLWDSWCEYVYNRPDPTGLKMNHNNPAYIDANHVSAMHCESLGIEA